MSVKSESKQPATSAIATAATSQPEAKQTAAAAPPAKAGLENLRDAIAQLDAERTAMVKNAIENLKPGRPFDSAVVRDINKLESRKNRLIVARFAALLKKSGPEVQAIAHQVIEL